MGQRYYAPPSWAEIQWPTVIQAPRDPLKTHPPIYPSARPPARQPACWPRTSDRSPVAARTPPPPALPCHDHLATAPPPAPCHDDHHPLRRGPPAYGGAIVAGECGRRRGLGHLWAGGPPRKGGIWAARSKSSCPY